MKKLRFGVGLKNIIYNETVDHALLNVRKSNMLMKVMMLTGIREMGMHEIPAPVIVNDTDVLIKMKTIGVCGSDVHYYNSGRIGSQVVKYPFPVGHEGAGQVIGIGPGVTHVKTGIELPLSLPCHVLNVISVLPEDTILVAN